nr:hypothetical protein [Pseudemcibacter aquimaris]
MKSNHFIKTLGYPTTEQITTPNFESCLNAINKIGFPVVIKPLGAGSSNGITANICNLNQAQAAYKLAEQLSPGNIAVEKYVEGAVYRIEVASGQINFVIEMTPAHVVGDGKNKIEELIRIENEKRFLDRENGGYLKDLKIDQFSLAELQNANLTVNSIPAKGEKAFLNRISHANFGATSKTIEIDQVHPDVQAMAIEVSKAFRLDVSGIDYITKDITKSWRESGTIIEINTFPSSNKERSMKIFEKEFSTPKNARIDTTLVISNKKDTSLHIYNEKLEKSPRTGYAHHDELIFSNGKMAVLNEGLHAKCLALLLNPTCEGMVVAMTPEDIVNDGLPIDQFSECFIDPNCNVQEYKMNELSLEDWLGQFVDKLETRAN